MRKFVIFLLLLLFVCISRGQNPINAFAKVTAISGTSLTVSNVNETYHSFEDGDYIIIIQMQDNVIGTNTTNASTFGNLGSIQSAGIYEVARISSHTEAASVPNSIVLTSSLANTYNINTNSSVQLVTYRFLGTNFTSTANIGTFSWNGNVGGVTAMSVSSVFTLGHNITANGMGFIGGQRNSTNGYTACDNSTYATAVATRYAAKGEGIYKNTTASFGGARGKILNGGGGGNDVNAGGGGGGNYSAGGGGGSGWTSSGAGCSPICGGLGGLSLSSSISGSRVFMGGGGGGGHQNDGNGSIGANGGGIIFIKTGTLQTTSCAGISISANGAAAGAATNDGAGGGGAGGTIVLQVGTYSIAGACPLTISANGGNGGNSNASSSGAHGGGGGGGQGAIIYSGAQPTANVTTNTSSGNGGVSCSGCSSGVNGSVGSGTVNSGVVQSSPGPLPIELIDFTAKLTAENYVQLEWKVAIEQNSEAYIIERMTEDGEVKNIAEIKTRGSFNSYSYLDEKPNKGINYYRLKTRESNGEYDTKFWVEIDVSKEYQDIEIYPNPVEEEKQLHVRAKGMSFGKGAYEIINSKAEKIIHHEFSNISYQTEMEIGLESLSAGFYILKFELNNKVLHKKFIIQ
ncbi:MAG: T9SS type A sorting domain-containing protein [Bacteroidia bacterium]|nr:T9SS type A sorting domain-containing protein [Bacteroidia bacterium]